MAKEAKKIEVPEVLKKKAFDREARWATHLEKYEASNPVKFAAKSKNGEFKKIPPSFK